MLSLRTDFNLRQDASRRYLPWITAFMVFLATMALAAAMIISAALMAWGQGLTGTVTVQIPPVLGDIQETERRLLAVLDMVERTPGVDRANVLDAAESRALLAVWLGDVEDDTDLPVPRIIDVRIRKHTEIDLIALHERLDTIAPGTLVDDHGRLLDDLIDVVNAVRLGAVVVVGVIALAAMLTVIYATRSGVAVHHSTIEVLHVMGASDDYIARQFQIRSLFISAWGGVLGYGGAALVLWAVGRILPRMELSVIPALDLGRGDWLVLALVPAIAALIAMAAARATVLRALRRMV